MSNHIQDKLLDAFRKHPNIELTYKDASVGGWMQINCGDIEDVSKEILSSLEFFQNKKDLDKMKRWLLYILSQMSQGHINNLTMIKKKDGAITTLLDEILLDIGYTISVSPEDGNNDQFELDLKDKGIDKDV